MSLLRRRAMMEGESHTRLEYLEFKDMAYIDTGYIPGDNTAFEFEAVFNVGAQCWYGSISTVPIAYSDGRPAGNPDAGGIGADCRKRGQNAWDSVYGIVPGV